MGKLSAPNLHIRILYISHLHAITLFDMNLRPGRVAIDQYQRSGKSIWRPSLPCKVELELLTIGSSSYVWDRDSQAQIGRSQNAREEAVFHLG
jgi:hypothetical protein